ncbi:MAG: LacI family transcriptional regulator [Chloroflexi bacterium]|nr:MAG: LacI family transcriptional regulator [Chloroflexota bacterium]TME03617.1 MAG: LacI family transcriptional regulator [Chloroflexota bacterium]TME41389.1 MAG: LacI family transcriptional regulator [Chloroflexota bacterium]TME52420.1 MAG: LacI family transcriptional regulator [Chloroflexota bacterium]
MEAVSRTQPTLDQVARAAGVSRATASRVFGGNPAVSEAARRAVELAAAELGYVPNSAARSLAGGRSDSVGVVVPEPGSRLFLDPLLPRLLRGVGEELSASGLQMVLFSPQSPTDLQRLEQYLAGGHVDAVLLLTLHESDVLPARLKARGIPTVFGGRPRGSIEVSFVDVDNHAGGRTATEHLIEQGRRVIAHISGPRGLHATDDRLHGFREAMWKAALRSDLVEHADLGRDSGEVAMERLLASTHRIDAVFAASDEMAAGAMWALQVLGRRVPDDVAVIGFDDSPVAAATQPPMSSVRQPIEEMGREMARLVLSLASKRGEGPQHMILGPELALRASTVGTG